MVGISRVRKTHKSLAGRSLYLKHDQKHLERIIIRTAPYKLRVFGLDTHFQDSGKRDANFSGFIRKFRIRIYEIMM